DEDRAAAPRERHDEALHLLQELVLREALALEAVGEVAVDRAAHAAVQRVEHLFGDPAPRRDRVDDLAVEAGEAERRGDLAPHLCAARPRQARDRDARPGPGAAAGLLPEPELVLQQRVDPPVERHGNLLLGAAGTGTEQDGANAPAGAVG